MFGAMHFIYYINRSIATKVDSTIWAIDQKHTEYNMSCSERWRLDHRVRRFPSTPHMSTLYLIQYYSLVYQNQYCTQDIINILNSFYTSNTKKRLNHCDMYIWSVFF